MKVIVIGAGAAGLSIGWRLAQAGADVVVIERAAPGGGATWAAAGMIAAPGDAPDAGNAEDQLAWQSAESWPRFAAEIEEASGRFISFHRNGALAVAFTQQQTDALGARAECGEGEIISIDAALAREPLLNPAISSALWMENEAQVDNRALGPALAIAFERAGGSLLVNETVVRFECHENRVLGVRTPFAVYHGDAYVLAAGAWSARIEGLPPGVMPPVIPVKGEMLALEPPAGETMPASAIVGNDIYLVGQRGQFLVGATVTREGFDTSTTDAAGRWLFDGAASLIPSLGRWSVAEHWAGLRPGTPDDLPVLGISLIDNLFIASGQYRSGILYAPAVADALAALIQGQDAPFDLAAFNPGRFRGTHYV
ncbi:MAG TPA: glycine oxidase ThiO [Rhizomicrobium sp.]